MQLVNPNLSVVGLPDYCLSYVENVFGTPHYYPTAWVGWENAKYKHTDTPPAEVCVPLWFAWSGTVDGVYANYGHVAVWAHGQVYTNPLSGKGHLVFNSIADLAAHYGVHYVGWSEDLAGVRIIEESLPRPVEPAPAPAPGPIMSTPPPEPPVPPVAPPPAPQPPVAPVTAPSTPTADPASPQPPVRPAPAIPPADSVIVSSAVIRHGWLQLLGDLWTRFLLHFAKR